MRCRMLAPIVAATLVLLAACAPAALSPAAPSFRIVEEGSGLLRLDPPGIGSGEAVFRLLLDVDNPNPVGLRIAGLDGALFLNERRVAAARFVGPLDLPAAGSGRLTLDVTVPVTGATELLLDLAELIGGAPIRYRLDAAVTVAVLGVEQRLPDIALVQGEWALAAQFEPPSILLDGDASRIRLAGTRVEVELALAISNPNNIGFALSAPALDIFLAGSPVTSAALATTPVPAFGTSRARLQFEFDLTSLGAVAAGQISAHAAGTTDLEVRVSGPLVLEVPGIATLPIAPGELLRERLR